jgi:hypothetical protein
MAVSNNQDNRPNAIQGSSKYGEDFCYEETKDTEAPGSLAQCVAMYQSTAQSGYIIFIFLLFPIQLIAAYVGWVLPDIYFKHKEDTKYDFERDVTFTNPLDAAEDPEEYSRQRQIREAQHRKVAEAHQKARMASSLKAEGEQLRDVELDGRSQAKETIIDKHASRALFLKKDPAGDR